MLMKRRGTLYLERVTETRAGFDTATPKCDREIGDIPLPVSMPRRGTRCSFVTYTGIWN
jgi:hypothetical protein